MASTCQNFAKVLPFTAKIRFINSSTASRKLCCTTWRRFFGWMGARYPRTRRKDPPQLTLGTRTLVLAT